MTNKSMVKTNSYTYKGKYKITSNNKIILRNRSRGRSLKKGENGPSQIWRKLFRCQTFLGYRQRRRIEEFAINPSQIHQYSLKLEGL